MTSHAAGLRILAALGVVAVILAGALSSRGDAAPNVRMQTPSQQGATLIVRTLGPDDLGRAVDRATSLGYVVQTRMPDLAAFAVQLPSGVTAGAAARDLVGHAGVLYVEPAYPVTTFDVPTDPLYRQQGYLEQVNAPEAWDIEQGSAGVLVAVLDTGIDVTHPDLGARVRVNGAEAPNGVDDDGNGCVDDVHGCAFVTSPSAGCAGAEQGAIADDDGHGTFVSGIIAASGNNDGMVGVARGVTILPVKVLDCAGSGDSLSLAQGILYAAKSGARVINVSLGGQNDSVFVSEAVRVARSQYNALVVAASGNTGAEGVAYPARYVETLAVGAATGEHADARASFSTSGPEVDVVAVGQRIVGTVPPALCDVFLPCIGNEPYGVGDGTSFSAPQVAGLVALILSRRPSMTPDAIIALVKQTAQPLPPGDRPNWSGAGRIDMLEAVRPQFQLGAPGVTRS